jgi:hypothetical protein
MVRLSLSGVDAGHELSHDEKHDHQQRLRREGVDFLKKCKPNERRERENRARNIVRAASKRTA